jgi:hypothetical protein
MSFSRIAAPVKMSIDSVDMIPIPSVCQVIAVIAALLKFDRTSDIVRHRHRASDGRDS